MPIEPNKPLKKCMYCLKEVSNLGLHIINQHPTILEQIEEKPTMSESSPVSLTYHNPTPQNRATSDINTMIKEKLDTIFNVMILKMLSEHPNMPLQDIQKLTQPPQNTTLQDVKAYHDMVYGDLQNRKETADNSNQWLELVNGALPIIAQMLPNKQAEAKNVEHRTDEERSISVLRPISQEIAGDREEPRGIGEESGIIIPTEQQNNNNINDLSERFRRTGE